MLAAMLLPSFLFSSIAYAQTEDVEEFTPSYEVNAPDWSDKELEQYYIDNDIFPANSSDDASKAALNEDGVTTHLTDRFPNYTWSKPTAIQEENGKKNMYEVSNVYGGNPQEQDPNGTFLQEVKQQAGITYKSIGCGPVSMVAQFDFLARYAKYSALGSDTPTYKEQVDLAAEVLEEIDTIPSDSTLGELFGKDPNGGTFTFPNSAIHGARQVLENHNFAVGSLESKSLIYVYGDLIPSLSSFQKKINNIIDSIDKGMPVIWWTTSGAGAYSNHYINIFGYKYWQGDDGNGNTVSHLMFKIRYNWNRKKVGYMDCDVLDAINCGFIFFEETHDRTRIKPTDYGFPCEYNGTAQTSIPVIATFKDETTFVSVNRLRAGYVKHYDSTNTYVDGNYLTLSAIKQSAGVAYIEYNFDKPVSHVSMEASWWRIGEGITIASGKAVVQYKDSKGNWVTAYNMLTDILLSTQITEPSRFAFALAESSSSIRIYVQSDIPKGSSNRGRLVIGNVDVFFA